MLKILFFKKNTNFVTPKNKVMRKVVLLSVMGLIMGGLFAQSKVTQLSGPAKAQKVPKVIYESSTPKKSGAVLQRPAVPVKATKSDSINKIVIGSSKNIYTALVSQSNVVSANQTLNTITMTRRGRISSANSGLIEVSVSKDGGVTWDSTLQLWTQYSSMPARYPSGVIYNPSGNTIPDSAFVVGSGPLLVGSSGWGGSFFSSVKLDGTSLNEQYKLYSDSTVDGYVLRFPRLYLQERKGKFFVLGEDNRDNGTNYTSFKAIINHGVWDPTGDSVIWSRSVLVPNFLTDLSGLPEGLSWPALIMDDNGQNGYIIYIGRDGDATDTLSYIPLIYKTTDGGVNWVKEQPFDWTTIPAVQEIANMSRVNRPFFGLIKDAVMDGRGRPHFICYVYPAWSNHPDSLGYHGVFTYHNGFVFDFYKDPTAGWKGFVIDTIRSKDVDDAHSPITDPLGWDERIQVARTPDGMHLVFAWMDTDTTLNAYNTNPDIILKSFDVAKDSLGNRINLTKGTAYDGNNYWMYLGDYCFIDANGNIIPHITTSDLNPSDVGPVKHYYIQGVKITALPNETKPVTFQVYPNPASDHLYVNLSDGKYNLTIYNALGNVVLAKQVNGGLNTIDLSKLPAGLYIVDVTSNNYHATQKVIKQ